MPGRLILIAGKDPTTETGGHSSYVRTHARAALRLGWEPHLYCVARQGGEVVTDFGIVHRVWSPFRPLRQVMLPGHGPLLGRGVRRALAAERGPALIHGFGLWGAAGVALARRRQAAGRPTAALVSCYTTYAHESAAKVRGVNRTHGWRRRLAQRVEATWVRRALAPLEALAYTRSRLVLVNYESVRRLLVQRFPGIGEIRKIPYTVEDELDTPGDPPARLPEDPAGPPLILSMARHDARKGLDVLLRALALLRRDGTAFRARLVGPGVLLEAHRRLAAGLGLADVEIPGGLPDVRPSLAQADVFVLPSVQEGSGSMALLEAMRAGRPLVAAAVDGVVEDVTDDVDGVLVPPGDPEALARALTGLLADRPRRWRLGRRARETFETRFGAAALVDALRATYAGVGFA